MIGQACRGTLMKSDGVIVDRTSQDWINCDWTRLTRARHLNAGCNRSSRTNRRAAPSSCSAEFHPQFGRLVDDDEQQFVVQVAQRHLGRQKCFEAQIVAIVHLLGEVVMGFSCQRFGRFRPIVNHASTSLNGALRRNILRFVTSHVLVSRFEIAFAPE